MIRTLEWKASTNAWIAFGVKNGLKPCSLETIKQIFTRSKKKRYDVVLDAQRAARDALL